MHIVILVTAKDKQEARKISAGLVEAGLAACVNIIGKAGSIFFWEGKIEEAEECLLIIKSRKEKLTRIIRLIKSLHSYKVPEIIALPVISGDKTYLRWIDESLRRTI